MTKPYGRRISALELLHDVSTHHPLPLSALVQVTRRCSLRCVHCLQARRRSSELSARHWGLVFDRLAAAGVLFLTVTGGEPTVRPDWQALLRAARERGFALKLKTNGVQLNETDAAFLARLPVMEVHVSFYSMNAARHDHITRVCGSHARTLGTLRRLRRMGVPVVLSCPLMRENASDVGALIDFAAKNDFGYMFDPAIVVREDGCTEPERRRIGEDAWLALLSDERIYAPKGPMKPGDKAVRQVCGIGKAMVAVAPNGDVWPCLSIQEKMGNLLEQDLKSIWVGNPILEKYASIRWKDLPTCRKCDLLPYCTRCHANAMREDGDLYGPSRLACQRARLIREVTERRLRGKSR